jgi:hypothetical protein
MKLSEISIAPEDEPIIIHLATRWMKKGKLFFTTAVTHDGFYDGDILDLAVVEIDYSELPNGNWITVTGSVDNPRTSDHLVDIDAEWLADTVELKYNRKNDEWWISGSSVDIRGGGVKP